MAPEEESDLDRIERVVSARIPRKRLDGFAYDATVAASPETPRAERSAQRVRAQGRRR